MVKEMARNLCATELHRACAGPGGELSCVESMFAETTLIEFCRRNFCNMNPSTYIFYNFDEHETRIRGFEPPPARKTTRRPLGHIDTSMRCLARKRRQSLRKIRPRCVHR